MSLRLRWTGLLFGGVLVVLVAVAGVVWTAGLSPFVRRVAAQHGRLVAEAARQLEAGTPERVVGKRFGIRVQRQQRPPRGPRCVQRFGPKRDFVWCRGRGGRAAARLDDGSWAVLRRPFRPEALGPRVASTFLILGILLGGACWLLAGRISRSLSITAAAMERVARGDLQHRISAPRGIGVKEAADAFNRMAERVARMVKVERSLMAGISHELRTPLARLRLETELLRDRENAPPERLDAMEADLADIDGLLEELFTVSRLAWEERAPERGQVDLEQVVHDALTQTSFERLTPRVEGEAVRVWGDHRQLVRSVQNLLENADKHGTGNEVTVRHLPDGFEVIDDGPGVDPSQLPRLFDPFYRGRAGGGTPGVGLGLMVVRQTMELHGGSAEARLVDAGPGKRGLAVRCRFPTASRPGRAGRQ